LGEKIQLMKTTEGFCRKMQGNIRNKVIEKWKNRKKHNVEEKLMKFI
jgi:hypothetical protein